MSITNIDGSVFKTKGTTALSMHDMHGLDFIPRREADGSTTPCRHKSQLRNFIEPPQGELGMDTNIGLVQHWPSRPQVTDYGQLARRKDRIYYHV